MPNTLHELQTLTGFDIRPDYVELVSNFPSQLMNIQRADDGSEAEGRVNTVELLSDPTDVLDINQEVRSSSIPHPDGHEFFWPDQVLAIGENGEGDYYAIDLAGEYPGVLFFDHQLVEFEEITDSLDEYVELLQESFAA